MRNKPDNLPAPAVTKLLTLLGEIRLWYHLLEPINVDWPELQNLFRQ